MLQCAFHDNSVLNPYAMANADDKVITAHANKSWEWRPGHGLKRSNTLKCNLDIYYCFIGRLGKGS